MTIGCFFFGHYWEKWSLDDAEWRDPLAPYVRYCERCQKFQKGFVASDHRILSTLS